LLDYIAKVYFPLEEGTDPNTREGNVCIRGSSMFTLVKNLNNISATAQEIGRGFAGRAGITTKEELIDKWKRTDVNAAFFFEDIELERNGNQFILYLVKPFWMKDTNLLGEVTEERRNNKFHPVCEFYKEYCKAIFSSVYGSVEIKPICSECSGEKRIFEVKITNNG